MLSIQLVLIIVVVLIISFLLPVAADVTNAPDLLAERLLIFHFYFLALGVWAVLVAIKFEALQAEVTRVRFLTIW